ncbi:MAG: prepilin-type N-terminal cleavage/methylation domain-containing protein [Elusimicrobia bacterium]|nr:prepilin-type N-terminal cleavage/methylation domain-containing protein [Elusimicrobiota bacterium]
MVTRREPRGFTLIEVMLVVAITSILASGGAVVLTQVFRFFRQTQARIEIQRDARAVFDQISRTLRSARASTIVIDQLTNQPPYSRITFTRIDGTALSYFQNGDTLYQVSGGTKSLCGNLRYIAFSTPRTDDDNIVSISLTLEKATYNSQTKALQLSVEKVKVNND